jgi:hypothetical protein
MSRAFTTEGKQSAAPLGISFVTNCQALVPSYQASSSDVITMCSARISLHETIRWDRAGNGRMAMNRLLLVLGALVAGALLIPDVAEAQRGGRGGGGARIGGGGFGGGGGFRGGGGYRGGGFGGGSRMYVPRGGARVGMGAGAYRGGAIAARSGRVAGIGAGTGAFRQAAINNPGGRFDNRFGNRGDWRYGYGATGRRYPYYGGRYSGRYPYYGGWGWGAAGLATGAAIGAAATYPYYNYPYSTYQTPVASAAGGYCVTSVRTCALTNSEPIGTGCSCSTSGGRARGTVQ